MISEHNVGKAISADVLRGISISPVVSEVYEHRVLDRLGTFLKLLTISLGLIRG